MAFQRCWADMGIFISLGVILGLLGGGALLLNAPSISSPSVTDMEENIRSEYEEVVSRETYSPFLYKNYFTETLQIHFSNSSIQLYFLVFFYLNVSRETC